MIVKVPSFARRAFAKVAVAAAVAGALLLIAPLTRSGYAVQERGLTGYARVLDGDTLDLSGTRIRLEGIDAPEAAQHCRAQSGRKVQAGRNATSALQRLVEGRELRCEVNGRDGYGRVIATCFSGSLNVNRQMVISGQAWAFLKYSKRYAGDEQAAKRARRGVWAAKCIRAVHYRQGHWLDGASKAPDGCAIKGNISRGKRIYHMPWDNWYRRTKIETARGERWFCSEAEAIAAGWRHALS